MHDSLKRRLTDADTLAVVFLVVLIVGTVAASVTVRNTRFDGRIMAGPPSDTIVSTERLTVYQPGAAARAVPAEASRFTTARPAVYPPRPAVAASPADLRMAPAPADALAWINERSSIHSRSAVEKRLPAAAARGMRPTDGVSTGPASRPSVGCDLRPGSIYFGFGHGTVFAAPVCAAGPARA